MTISAVSPQALKENICFKTLKVPLRPGVRLCLERPRLLTQSYKETEGEPMVLRRAKALSRILENMTVYIQDGERIVGNFASDPYSLTFYPELYCRWVEKAVNDGYRDLLDEKGMDELREINEYWGNKSVHSLDSKYVSRDYWRDTGGAFVWFYLFEGGIPNYEKIFQIGLNGIIEQVEQRLTEIEADTTIHAKDFIEQKNTLEALIISLRAVINFSKRYADKAKELARDEEDEKRRKELMEIAAICDWIPANPPTTFHEALQSFWLIHMITHIIEIPMVGCGVRFDRIFYPFYRKDKEEGRITGQEAQELLEFLWVKFEEVGHLHPPMMAEAGAGANMWQTIIIGGTTPEGEDATNEVSYMVLEAAKSMRTLQPPVAIRYHDKIPNDLIMSAIDLIKISHAHPAFFNDKAMVPWLTTKKGILLKDARDYGINSCMEWNIPGKNILTRTSAGLILLPKCLELALNKGVDKFSGKQIGFPTPDPATFKSIDHVMEAFLKQVSFFSGRAARMSDIGDALYEEYLPRPFMSALIDDCIEKGKDCRRWSYHGKRAPCTVGANNVADSLAAMKKFVFEEKRVPLEELLDTLKHNWDGKEDLRRLMLSAPKFGNDDDYVDLMAREVQVRVTEEMEKHPGYYGVSLSPEGSVAAAPYAMAIFTGATPDGRKDGEPFHDGTISPVQGRDANGPTAVLKSASKVDPVVTYNHLLNQKFMPQFLEGDSRDAFAAYLKTWSELGIYHIQFNVVDRDILLDAQEHPDDHNNLMVRVCGYAAYFVDMSKGLQDDIIARTEQNL